ncbi:hypothetical protein [Promicromonospora sukumoe]
MANPRQTSIREGITRTALVAMGVLTAFPVLSLVNPAQLESYGVVDPDPIVLTLLQHRGVFQLLLGAALVWAAFRPGVRVPVALAAIVSKGVALGLTVSRPDVLAEASTTVLVFDPVCLVLLTALLADVAVGRRRRVREGVPA